MLEKETLDALLTIYPRGDARDNQWPDHHGEYWGLCPACARPGVGESHLGPKGFKCFGCGATTRELAAEAERRGVAVLQCFQRDEAQHIPVTLEAYAAKKHLPVPFLQELGLYDYTYKGETRVGIPYYDESGNKVTYRRRVSLTAKNHTKSALGSHAMLYGLWRLDDARAAGYVILVEGESDSQTLWYHGLPALGVPGASSWQAEWTPYLEGLTVYVWQEPDQGGKTLIPSVGKCRPDALIISPEPGNKDISEAHILGHDVPALVAKLRASAARYADILDAERSGAAAKANAEAGPLLGCPDILSEFASLCERMGLAGESENAKLLYLALTSRLLDKPVSVAVKGPSSGGKSFLVETVLQTFPDDAHLDFTSMSERALIYDERSISHKFIVLFEASGLGADKQGEPSVLAYCIRSLLSEGHITYTTVEKVDSGMQARVIDRPGPTGLITTTTWASLHPENETRMLSITVKDDREQTRKVFAALADRANTTGPAPVNLDAWRALQTWLELAGCREVTIPYAHKLAELADPAAVRLRRDFGKLLSLIQIHAILQQGQRERDARGRIVATIADYRAVHGLIADLVAEGAESAVSESVRETVGAVKDLSKSGSETVSVTQVAAKLELDKASASRRVRAALGLGYIANAEDRRGKPYRLTVGDPLPAETPILPAPEQLADAAEAPTAEAAHDESVVCSIPPETLQQCNTLAKQAELESVVRSIPLETLQQCNTRKDPFDSWFDAIADPEHTRRVKEAYAQQQAAGTLDER